MAAQMSQLKPYSIGVVAEHKVIGASKILVTPIEDTPIMDGVLKSDPTVIDTKGVDASGTEYQVSVMTDTTVEATWLPESSNRRSAPDVRRSERVQLYKFADSDTFYWRELGLDGHLRRLETVLYVFNNNPDATGADTVDPATSYFLEVSTHTGAISLITSKSNGEPFAYTVQLNTKEGAFSIADDADNELTFDSGDKHIFAKLSTGTEFNLDVNNIYGYAPDTIRFVAKNSIVMECKDFQLTAANSYTCDTKKWVTTCPDGTFTGVFRVGALETVSGDYAGTATIGTALVVEQNITAKKDVTVAGTLSAQKVISAENIDAPNV